MSVQATANRAAHALAHAQDVTTAGMFPIWWDNGGSGSFGLFATNVRALMTAVKNCQAAPNTWATLSTP
jgi:hypothetical protein